MGDANNAYQYIYESNLVLSAAAVDLSSSRSSARSLCGLWA